jgi:hypothetical protein
MDKIYTVTKAKYTPSDYSVSDNGFTHRGGWGGGGRAGGCCTTHTPTIASSVTIYAKTTVHCSPDSIVHSLACFVNTVHLRNDNT